MDSQATSSFLINNQECFSFLLAFLVMSKGFKFAFAEVNFPPDIDALITALQTHPKCQTIQLEILTFNDPDLRFLLEALKQALCNIEIEPNKKLVLIIRGLEKAIGSTENNPPILTNLNYARDSFPSAIPHPVVFILPDYAVTRVAQFAPDFWAWTSATFKFKTSPSLIDQALEQVFQEIDLKRFYTKTEKSENIDLLERLLQEYLDDTEASIRTRIEILNQLGQEYYSIREFNTAATYFKTALESCRNLNYQQSEEVIFLYNLGIVSYQKRDFEQARAFLLKAIAIQEKLGYQQEKASIYHLLGMICQELREYEEARKNFEQALAICIKYNDRYNQEKIYHQLGNLAFELRKYEEARKNYQQALSIDIEYGDRYSQAGTYHNLGLIDEDLEDLQEAQNNFLKALQIWVEFNDQYQLDNVSIPSLLLIYQKTQDPKLLETIAQTLNVSVDEITKKFMSDEE